MSQQTEEGFKLSSQQKTKTLETSTQQKEDPMKSKQTISLEIQANEPIEDAEKDMEQFSKKIMSESGD